MFSTSITNWYTDLVTIKRDVASKSGNITKQTRAVVAENIPCRVYKSSAPTAFMKDTAAEVSLNDMLACANDVDIRTGDELLVIRGGVLGSSRPPTRYFAGEPTPYFVPFGGVSPDLAHQQIPISGEKRIG